VAAADVNGDGVADVITAAGPGGGPHVQVFDGLSGQTLFSFFAYDPGFQGGVFVAGGDVNGDGFADIITGAGRGGGPHVKVFDGQTPQELHSFFAFEEAFTGGVTVAAGDVNADGFSDLIMAAGPGGGPRVRVMDGLSSQMLADFMAYNPAFAGGVRVAAGDVDGDGSADVITGAGAGGGPHVRIFSGQNLPQVLNDFFAFNDNVTGGIFVAATDTNGDGLAEILVGTGPGPERPGEIRVLSRLGEIIQPSTIIFNAHFRSGIHVGASLTLPLTQAIPASLPPSGAAFTVGGFDIDPLPDELLAFLFDDSFFDALLDLEPAGSQA
jgi:hypothetical protein